MLLFCCIISVGICWLYERIYKEVSENLLKHHHVQVCGHGCHWKFLQLGTKAVHFLHRLPLTLFTLLPATILMYKVKLCLWKVTRQRIAIIFVLSRHLPPLAHACWHPRMPTLWWLVITKGSHHYDTLSLWYTGLHWSSLCALGSSWNTRSTWLTRSSRPSRTAWSTWTQGECSLFTMYITLP